MVRKWKHFGRFNFAEEKILNEGVIGRYSFFQFFRWIRVCRRCQASNRIRNKNLTILNAKQIGIFRLYCLWSSVTTKNSVNIFTIYVRTNRFTAWHMKMHLWPSFDTINSCITLLRTTVLWNVPISEVFCYCCRWIYAIFTTSTYSLDSLIQIYLLWGSNLECHTLIRL